MLPERKFTCHRDISTKCHTYDFEMMHNSVLEG